MCERVEPADVCMLRTIEAIVKERLRCLDLHDSFLGLQNYFKSLFKALSLNMME